MSDEKNGFEVGQPGKAAGNCGVSLDVAAELPTHKARRPIAIGFALGAMYFFYALLGGTLAEISLIQLLIQLTGLLGIGILGSMGFKEWMGSRWSNQHRFVRSVLFLANVCYGIALFVMAFGVFGFFFLRG